MKRKVKLISILTFLLSFGVALSPALAITVVAPDSVPIGTPFPVRISGGEELTSVTALWMGRHVPFEAVKEGEGKVWVADLVCSALEGRPGRQMVLIEAVCGERVERLPWQITVKKRTFPVTELTVAPEKAVPPPSVRDRILRESREAALVLTRESFPSRWSLPLVPPVAGAVTSPYGTERIFNGKRRSRHGGIDFRAAPGTPVLAVAGGTVVLTGERYFSGKTVFVDHGGGRISLYGHLSRIDVREGQPVAAGEVLGLSGATGRVTGPHLHFGLAFHGALADAAVLFQGSEKAFLSGCREVSVSLD